jgi:hypothetical protein
MLENEAKHEGFLWVVRRNQTCAGGRYCVRDFRVQVHFMGNHDAPVRYHSFSVEARLCVNPSDLSTCGIYRLGGWIDYARLYVPPQAAGQTVDCWSTFNGFLEGKPEAAQFGQYIAQLPNYNQFYPVTLDDLPNDELRCHKQLPASVIQSNPTGIANATEWWAHTPFDFRYQFRLWNPNGGVTLTPDGTGAVIGAPYCDASSTTCRWSHSRFTLELDYVVPIGRWMDGNGDGITDFSDFVGRLGQPVPGCEEAGLNCIPASVTGIRLNPGGLGYNHDLGAGVPFDYDVTPPGIPSWITWYRKYGM